MSEHNGSFAETLNTQEAYPNGHEAAEEAAPLSTAQVDAARQVFITSRGEVIELSGKRVSSLMLERLASEGRPRIPLKEVTLLGKHKQTEPNPSDPGYLQLLGEWEAESRVRALVYTFTVGVKGQPPAEFVEEQREFFPDASDAMLKYLWIASRLPDEDIGLLSEAIIGMALPTTKGLEDAANFSA